MLVRRGTPAEIVDRLCRGVGAKIARPDVAERRMAVGYVPVGTPPVESDAELRREIAKWGKVVRAAGIKLS